MSETAAGWKSSLQKLDASIGNAERLLAGIFCGLLCLLIALNILVRMLRIPVFWVDEVAIYCMVWMAFLAAGSAVQSSEHVAVDILTKFLPEKVCSILDVVVTLILFAIGIALIICAWIWFDPIGILASGGNAELFAERNLNFIYSEPTASFEAPKALFWLVMPIFSLSLCFHAAVKLIAPTSKAGEA
ncbi:MAG: hypothetical protein CMK07_03855 [Ponticaulis sp.]|nr:hypothetical protein [Ponticaulis sp.]